MFDHLDFTLILDRSGSMDPIRSIVIDEVNRLLDQLRADDPDTTVSIVAFAGRSDIDVLVDAVPVRRVRSIAARHYEPGGPTALLDAVGTTLRSISTRLHTFPTTPRVVVAVITDGAENDSVDHSWRDIAGKLARRRAGRWELAYLGPGHALDDARRMGFAHGEVHPWSLTEAGTRAAFATVVGTALRPDEPGSLGAFLDGLVRRDRDDLGAELREACAQQHRRAQRRDPRTRAN